MKKILPGILFLSLAFAAVYFVYTNSLEQSSKVGMQVQNITLETLNSQDITIEFGDKPAIVNFFASWCQPCIVEHPILTRISEHNLVKSGQLKMIGIAYRDKPENIREFLQIHGDPFNTVAIDNSGVAGIGFGIGGLPETLFIDKQGRVIGSHVGPISALGMHQEVIPLMQKMVK